MDPFQEAASDHKNAPRETKARIHYKTEEIVSKKQVNPRCKLADITNNVKDTKIPVKVTTQTLHPDRLCRGKLHAEVGSNTDVKQTALESLSLLPVSKNILRGSGFALQSDTLAITQQLDSLMSMCKRPSCSDAPIVPYTSPLEQGETEDTQADQQTTTDESDRDASDLEESDCSTLPELEWVTVHDQEAVDLSDADRSMEIVIPYEEYCTQESSALVGATDVQGTDWEHTNTNGTFDSDSDDVSILKKAGCMQIDEVDASQVPSQLIKHSQDPQMCYEYYDSILDNMFLAEAKPYNSFLRAIPTHKGSFVMERAATVNWLVLLQIKYSFLQETLFRAVLLLDTVFDRSPHPWTDFKSIGLTVLFIAAKYEEIETPTPDLFHLMGNRLLSRKKIIDSERNVLAILSMRLMRPISLQFLRQFSYSSRSDVVLHSLSKYFCELAMLCPIAARWKPSFAAVCSLCLAKLLLEPWEDSDGQWFTRIATLSRHSLEDIRVGCADLARLQISVRQYDRKLDAIDIKYSSAMFEQVSKLDILDKNRLNELASRSLKCVAWPLH